MITASRPARRGHSGAVLLLGLLLAWLSILLTGQLAMAGSAAAHAELVGTTPSNGEQLVGPPAQVTLRFTESVRLIDGGIELLDAQGDPVATPEPVAHASTVHWQMPADLADGAYLVNWRVISGDSHPVSGAFSFGVGAAAAAVDVPAGSSGVPWQVTASRLGGYVGFSLVAGVIVLTMVCWPAGRRHRRAQLVLCSGLLIASLSTLAGLLAQGPYVAEKPMTRMLDSSLLAQVHHTPFGAWTEIRLVLYLAMAGVLWARGALESRANRWFATLALGALAVTYSGTGHAAASGRLLDRAADSVHVLAAGVWLGGLATLAVVAATRSERPTMEAFVAFSRVALLSVLTLVATGAVNMLLQLDAIAQLWRTTYGQLLSAKLTLVAAALVAAWFSRRRLRREEEPWGTVRVEAATTLAVLAVTAVLASTAPPSAPTPWSPTTGEQARSSTTTVDMDLGADRTARLHVDGLGTRGSTLHLELLDASHEPLAARTVQLRATLPSRDLGPLDVPLTKSPEGWFGKFRFPFPGRWGISLTVEDRNLAAVVTTKQLDIR